MGFIVERTSDIEIAVVKWHPEWWRWW